MSSHIRQNAWYDEEKKDPGHTGNDNVLVHWRLKCMNKPQRQVAAGQWRVLKATQKEASMYS